MIYNRPLIQLFLLATIAVDAALLVGNQGPVLEGILVGQVAALAIWAAIGHRSYWHRLTRGSLLVVGVGVLAYLPGYRSLNAYSHNLTFMAGYALLVVVTSLIVVWLQSQVRIRFSGDREEAPLKIPLIEFFGWTIVVAVVSFGVRYMDANVVERVFRVPSTYVMRFAIAPLAVVLLNSRFRRWHLVRAGLLLGMVYLAGVVLGFRTRIIIEMMSSATYICAWLLVRSIEYDQLKTTEEDSKDQKDKTIKLADLEE